MPRAQLSLSSVYAPRLYCPRPLVISCLSLGGVLLPPICCLLCFDSIYSQVWGSIGAICRSFG